MTDAAGHEAWRAIVGTGETVGRSLKTIDYQETFSNAIQRWIQTTPPVERIGQL
jgi:hypothetical protein